MNTIVGNLTRDPELKFLDSGTATARIDVAVSKSWTNRAGEKEEKTSFFAVSLFGTLAENVASSCKRGDRVICVGDFEQRSWETPTGEKRSVVEFKATEVGPSLKWALAVVSKTDSRKATQSSPEEPF